MAVDLRKHADGPLPAPERIVMRDQQFAHERGIGHDHRMLGPHAHVHDVTVCALPAGQRAEQVVRHRAQQPQPVRPARGPGGHTPGG